MSNVIDAQHLERQIRWSLNTFGPGNRTWGIIDHIQKELVEISEDHSRAAGDWHEWIDVVILALDGAWRAGAKPQEIIDWLLEKQRINEGREWPDWREFTDGQAIEHVRT